MTTVWEKSRASGDGLLLLLAIADYANDKGEAWPAMGSLASRARCSKRHARRLVNQLVKLGDLAVSRGTGRHHCNRYTVTLCPGDTVSGEDTPSGGHSRQERGTSATEKEDPQVLRSVSTRQEPSTVQQEGKDSPGSSNGASPPPPATARSRRDAVQASKIQWAALKKGIEELELAKKSGEFTVEQRDELRQLRKDMAILQKKQRRGQF